MLNLLSDIPLILQVIELLPPSGDGNAIEMLLRNSSIKAMSSFPEMTQNAVFRAMNAIAPTIASYSKLICQIMEVNAISYATILHMKYLRRL